MDNLTWKIKRGLTVLSCLGLLVLSASNQAIAQTNSPVKVPAGLSFQKLPAQLDKPRLMSFTKEGDLIVGSASGKIYRLKAPYTQSEVLADFGGYPHGIALRNLAAKQELWVAETEGLYRVDYDSKRTYKRADFIKVVSLPGGAGHNSRTVKVGPDNMIYVSLGIAGNCSIQYLDESFPFADRRGGIFQLQESASEAKLVPYGSGLRNPIGFDWHPETGQLYAENNGPDNWGFDKPAEVFVEVNNGSFFGMPWYQVIDGKVTVDSCTGTSKAPLSTSRVELPVASFPARSAPMDMQFVAANQLNASWNGSALVALHGSWAIPTGGGAGQRRPPELVLVEFDNGKATGKVSSILSGFQSANGTRYARPVGLAFGPDNALYMSSDAGDVIGIFRLKNIED